MQSKSIMRRLGISLFGLACLTLFLGTETESCTGCSSFPSAAESRGFIRIIHFLDLEEYVCLETWGNRRDVSFYNGDDGWIHTWESPGDNPVFQKPVEEGTYDFWWRTRRGYRTKTGSGVLVIKKGATTILNIK